MSRQSMFRRVRRQVFRVVDRAGLTSALPLPAAHRARLEESRLRAQARLALSDGDRDRARHLLETATLRFGSHPETWELFARLLDRAEENDEAIRAIGRVLEFEPDSTSALDLLLVLLTTEGRQDEIAPVLDRFVAALVGVSAERAVRLREVLPVLRQHGRIADARRVLDAHPVPAGRDELRTVRILVALHGRAEAAPDDVETAVTELTAGLSAHDRAGVVGRYWLDVGDATRAVAAFGALPDGLIPLAEIRRQARHLGAAGFVAESTALAAFAWERSPDDELGGLPGARTLLRAGYPFDPPVPEPVYETDPRRVLYLLHNSLPLRSAGYATRTHGLLMGLRRAGWLVDGVTRLGFPHDQHPEEEAAALVVPESDLVDGVPYRRLIDPAQLRVPKSSLVAYIQKYAVWLERLARAERPAILHAASNHWNGLAAGVVAGRLGIPYVYEVRGLWEVTRGSREPAYVGSGRYNLQARMEADAAKRADRVITITGALRDEMVRRGVPEGKISIVPNGVDTSRFTPLPRDAGLAAELGMTGKTVIGYVGSILDYEGLELLIDATAALKAERQDFAVLIVGDGTALPTVKARAKRLGLDDVVTFTGRVPHEQVERYYSVVDIAPFPRRPLAVCEMVSPLKPFEAMAMAKAVVVSSVAALTEIVTDGANGLVHTKGDVPSLTGALRRLLDDPDLRDRVAQGGLEWVRAERDWTALAGRVDRIYTDVLEARSART
jgi:PEP-CTERM/exosortase A-associated glycosyltransferase